MNESCVARLAGSLLALVLCLGFLATPVRAALIQVGTPTNTVPAALDDPIASLSSPLPAGQILVPIEITGANGLQDWTFDLTFDGSVVTLVDAGFFHGVYAAHFNAIDPTLSGITSSGFLGMNELALIGGESFGVSGDGLLVFVLFERNAGQTGDPDFDIANQSVTQQAPAPGTLVLLIPALAALRLRGRKTT